MAAPSLHPSARALAAALAVSAVLFGAEVRPAAEKHASGGYNIPLWDEGKAPMSKGDGPLDKPFLTVFAPAENKRNGAAVVIAPGGSNIMLMYGAEGIDIAERYNDWGVTAFVLTYRLAPRYNDEVRIMDGKRAIQTVRAHASEFGIDSTKVGYIGFSAGSNMGRPLVDASGPGNPDSSDPVERMSSRPDYLALVYGPGRPMPGEILKNFPPVFLVSAAGDTGPSVGNAAFFTELVRAGAVAEIHVYQKGHHGFGDGYADPNTSDWMGRLEHFLRYDGLLPGAKQ